MWVYNETPESELYHYGVKGMRWGVRRDYLAEDRARAQKKLDNARTERQKSRAQERVDRLAKADTAVYNRLRARQRVRKTIVGAYVGAVVAKEVLNKIGDRRISSLDSLTNLLPDTIS